MLGTSAMRRILLACCAPFLLALCASAASAQGLPESNSEDDSEEDSEYEFDYDADVPLADEPIESEVFREQRTFTTIGGTVMVLYGQFNLA